MSAEVALKTPLLLEGSLHETIWGGQHLATVAGKQLPPDARVGESWETEVRCRVRNAPFAGESLGSLVSQFGESLVGWRAVEVFGRRFPLLTKFIDAQQKLSVQVHPNDDYAAAHEGGKLGKTECWYILRAEPGAELVYGLRRAVTHEEMRQAIAETRLEDLLNSIEAHAGDIFFVPAGTVHAIGAGIVVYELQEYSDVTYRLYDYGRVDATGQQRELHVERALDVMDFTPARTSRFTPITLPLVDGLVMRRVLVACDYFVLEEMRIEGGFESASRPESCEILTVLEGTASVVSAGAPLALIQGDTVVVPAACDGYRIEGTSARVVRSFVPTQADDSLSKWLAAQRGISA